MLNICFSVTAEKWVPIIEVPVSNVTGFLEKKKKEGYSILGLEQTANSVTLDQYVFPKKTVKHNFVLPFDFTYGDINSFMNMQVRNYLHLL